MRAIAASCEGGTEQTATWNASIVLPAVADTAGEDVTGQTLFQLSVGRGLAFGHPSDHPTRTGMPQPALPWLHE